MVWAVSGEGWVSELDYGDVEELRARVASRLAADQSGRIGRLDEASRAEMVRALVVEESCSSG